MEKEKQNLCNRDLLSQKSAAQPEIPNQKQMIREALIERIMYKQRILMD